MCAINNWTYEIHSNSAYVRVSVCVISEPQEQARLTNTWITNQQQLEQVIAEIRNGHIIRNVAIRMRDATLMGALWGNTGQRQNPIPEVKFNAIYLLIWTHVVGFCWRVFAEMMTTAVAAAKGRSRLRVDTTSDNKPNTTAECYWNIYCLALDDVVSIIPEFGVETRRERPKRRMCTICAAKTGRRDAETQ